MLLDIVHETRYRYHNPVVLSQHLLHVMPRELPWQTLQSYRLTVNPEPTEICERYDYFGNPATSLVIASPHTELAVRTETRVNVAARAAPAERAADAWEAVRARLRRLDTVPLLDPAQFLFESPRIELLRDLARYAEPSFPAGGSLFECVRDLTRRIHIDYSFDPRATSVETPLREVISRRRGVCQDFAHLMIGCLRTLGLAARYVSGYILTQPPPGRPRLIGADASHAWVSVYCPPLGWVDFDPTNDRLVDDEHATLAWGRDFADVTPLRGVILGGDEHDLEVSVTVLPVKGGRNPEASR